MSNVQLPVAEWLSGLVPWIIRERRTIAEWEDWGRGSLETPEPDSEGRRGAERGNGNGRDLWLRAEAKVPPAWRGQRGALFLELCTPSGDSPGAVEALLYVNGMATQGLHLGRAEVLLAPEHQSADSLHLAIQVWNHPARNFPHAVLRLDLVRLDADLEDLYFTLRVAGDLARTLDPHHPLRASLRDLVDTARLQLEPTKAGSEEFYRRVREVNGWIQSQVVKLKEKADLEARPIAEVRGHFPLAIHSGSSLYRGRWEARRTFATAGHLMRHYPDCLLFPLHTQWVRFLQRDDPELFRRFQAILASGRWKVPVGLWTESDGRISSGESLVRQLLYSVRFYHEQFNCECDSLWLPDLAGFGGGFPQLVQKSGLKLLVAERIPWTEPPLRPSIRKFLWRGTDGTEVLVYVPLIVSWSEASSEDNPFLGQVTEALKRSSAGEELWVACTSPGGPGREMLEYACHLQDLPVPFAFQIGPTSRLISREEAGEYVWTGEIPPSPPRSPYPSSFQKANRECEVLFHNAELWETISLTYGGRQKEGAGALREGWERFLVNQSFRFLAGMDRPALQERLRDYEEVSNLGTAVLEDALSALAARVTLPEEALLVFNPCSWSRTDTVAVPWTGDPTDLDLRDPTGQEVEYQVVQTENGTELVFTAEEVPAVGYRAYSIGPARAAEAPGQVKGDYGPLTMLLNDPAVTHIQVQSPYQVFAERAGKLEIVAERFRDEDHVRAVADRLAEMVGAVLDEAHPEFDQMWPDGSRLRVQIPPQSLRGTLITIWKKEENPVEELERRYAILQAALSPKRKNPFKVNPRRLENDFFRLTLNDFGQIIDLYDKLRGRDVFPPDTPGNVFQVGAPKNGGASAPGGEAGEILSRLISAKVREGGPERGVVELTWRYRTSQVRQRLTLYRAVPRIDFITEIDWQEPHKSLQVTFPVEVQALQATYEGQFGNVVRPTYRNLNEEPTSGRPMGKWMDLSEGDYGVSLLNDGPSDHDIRHNVLVLTLLHPSTGLPDVPHRRRLTYSLYPHSEDWSRGDTVRQAYQLNYSLLVRREPAHPGELPASYSFVSVDADHVILETIKRSEEGEGWIVRAYDYANRRGPVTLTFGQPLASAAECNLLEDPEQLLKPRGRTLEFQIRPYEVKTFKVWLTPTVSELPEQPSSPLL